MSGINFEEVKKDDPPGQPVILTDDNFDDFTGMFPLVVVDFWAPWCGPCKMIAPVVEEIAGELKGKVAFGKVNTDENPRTPGKFRIMAIPTLLVFKNGEMQDQIVGFMPKKALVEKIESYL